MTGLHDQPDAVILLILMGLALWSIRVLQMNSRLALRRFANSAGFELHADFRAAQTRRR